MGCQCGKSTQVKENAHVPGSSSAAKPSAPAKPGAPVPADVINKKVEQGKKTGVLPLRECGLKALPPAACGSGTDKMRTVDVSINALTALPDSISSWVGVQNLLCERNALTQLPSAMGQLASLQKLVLTGNKLQDLGPGLPQLGKLKILQLDGNSLGPKLPDAFFGGALNTSLEELDLSGNALQELPSSLANLKQLTRLVVSKNSLREFPAGLASAAKLQYLDAAENSISVVQPSLLEETNLSELWLKGNPIDRLVLQETPGFAAFMERRKKRLDAKIDSCVVGAVNLAVCGLD